MPHISPCPGAPGPTVVHCRGARASRRSRSRDASFEPLAPSTGTLDVRAEGGKRIGARPGAGRVARASLSAGAGQAGPALTGAVGPPAARAARRALIELERLAALADPAPHGRRSAQDERVGRHVAG